MQGFEVQPPSIEEHEVPGRSKVGLRKGEQIRLKAHDASTRRGIAWAILGVLAALLVWTVVLFTLGVIDADDLTQLTVLLGGFQTLAAAVIGFYFGNRR